MTGLLFLKLIAIVVSVALASGILARDHGLKANRLLAAFLFCNAYWACGEFVLYQSTDPALAARAYRMMSLGWIPLGVLCAHASVTLSAMEHHPVAKVIPGSYVAIALLLPFAMGTNWVVVEAEQTALGWRPVFGPGMMFAYLLLAAPLCSILVCWRQVLRLADGGGQTQLARIVFFGMSTALVVGTMTAIVLPFFKIDSVGITTTLVSFVGLAAAWTLSRFGHTLISPDAFAREILDTLDDGVILVGEGGVLRDANRAFRRMLGSSEGDVIDRPITDWIPDFPLDVRASSGPATSSVHELHSAIREPLPIVLSPPVDCTSGGRRVGQAFLVRDRREIVSLQRQLAVSARLAAVGDLTRSISQSINEPVARVREEFEGLSIDWQTTRDIVELASLEEECHEALDEGAELITECVEGIDRIFSVVREVTGFSGEKEKQEFAVHALDLIVRRAIRIAEVQAPEGLKIEARLDGDVRILCHFAAIERVVTNLLVNAIHALECREPGRAFLVIGVVEQGGRALLHIEDNGCGIKNDALERIFDPFFTTKPVGKGTGLGLAISYHTIRMHGGEIRISSIQDQGTSVAVELPAETAEDEAACGETAGAP